MSMPTPEAALRFVWKFDMASCRFMLLKNSGVNTQACQNSSGEQNPPLTGDL
jgi:hypothetical protein